MYEVLRVKKEIREWSCTPATPVFGNKGLRQEGHTGACWLPASLAPGSGRGPVSCGQGTEVQRRAPDILIWPPHASTHALTHGLTPENQVPLCGRPCMAWGFSPKGQPVSTDPRCSPVKPARNLLPQPTGLLPVPARPDPIKSQLAWRPEVP